MIEDLEVLITAEEIRARVRELGEAISKDYQGKYPLLVTVLKGAVYFLVDLTRVITVPHSVDFMAITSYGPGADSLGVVRIIKDLDENIEGRHVLVVEDVIDTGLTLGYLLRNLQARRPLSLKVCTLLDKPAHRIVDLPIEYRGFTIPDKFVIGYGLDYRQRYRNLPFIGFLKPEAATG